MKWNQLLLTMGVVALVVMAPVYGFQWRNFWLNENQQAVASYRAEDYASAMNRYASMRNQDADTAYNLGNTLVKMGRYEEAKHAYERAIQRNPKHADARYNKRLLERMAQRQAQANQAPSNVNDGIPSEPIMPNQIDGPESHQETPQGTALPHGPGDTLNQQKPSQQGKPQYLPRESAQTNEAERALMQWVHLIPDDPGGFLREKFRRDYLRNHSQSGV